MPQRGRPFGIPAATLAVGYKLVRRGIYDTVCAYSAVAPTTIDAAFRPHPTRASVGVFCKFSPFIPPRRTAVQRKSVRQVPRQRQRSATLSVSSILRRTRFRAVANVAAGIPKGRPLWGIFGYFLCKQKVTRAGARNSPWALYSEFFLILANARETGRGFVAPATTYFALGGKVGKTPLGAAAPRPRLRSAASACNLVRRNRNDTPIVADRWR